jgi:hypothetical protein
MDRLTRRSEIARSRAPVLPKVRDAHDQRRPFVIASHTEPELAAFLRGQTLGYTTGFLGPAVILGYGLLSQIGASP